MKKKPFIVHLIKFLTFLAIVVFDLRCLTFKTTPPLPEPSSPSTDKSSCVKSPIFSLHFKNSSSLSFWVVVMSNCWTSSESWAIERLVDWFVNWSFLSSLGLFVVVGCVILMVNGAGLCFVLLFVSNEIKKKKID